MSSLPRNLSFENLSNDINNILLDKNLSKLQIVSLIDGVLFLLLTSCSYYYFTPLSILCGLSVLGIRMKSINIINLNFLLGFSSIPLRIILMIYYNYFVTVFIGILSLFSQILQIWYTCHSLSLLKNQKKEIEINNKKISNNPSSLGVVQQENGDNNIL